MPLFSCSESEGIGGKDESYSIASGLVFYCATISLDDLHNLHFISSFFCGSIW
jgi:hypothetical protein